MFASLLVSLKSNLLSVLASSRSADPIHSPHTDQSAHSYKKTSASSNNLPFDAVSQSDVALSSRLRSLPEWCKPDPLRGSIRRSGKQLLHHLIGPSRIVTLGKNKIKTQHRVVTNFPGRLFTCGTFAAPLRRVEFQSGTEVDIEASSCFHTNTYPSPLVVRQRRWQPSGR